MSPLHDACRDGDTERVRQLLDEGAAVDEKDKNGDTALMLASENGHTEVVQQLRGTVQSSESCPYLRRRILGRTAIPYALMLASRGGHTRSG